VSGYSPLPPPWGSSLPDDIAAALPHEPSGQKRLRRGTRRSLPHWQAAVFLLVVIAIIAGLIMAVIAH